MKRIFRKSLTALNKKLNALVTGSFSFLLKSGFHLAQYLECYGDGKTKIPTKTFPFLEISEDNASEEIFSKSPERIRDFVECIGEGMKTKHLQKS